VQKIVIEILIEIMIEIVLEIGRRGCCPVSERLAKQLSKKISASFELTRKPQWENFGLANRSLTGHGRGSTVQKIVIEN